MYEPKTDKKTPADLTMNSADFDAAMRRVLQVAPPQELPKTKRVAKVKTPAKAKALPKRKG